MNDYHDKHWVVQQIESFLKSSPDEHAAFLLPRFKWLLEVWNTNRDFEYPSLEEYDPNNDEEDEDDVLEAEETDGGDAVHP